MENSDENSTQRLVPWTGQGDPASNNVVSIPHDYTPADTPGGEAAAPIVISNSPHAQIAGSIHYHQGNSVYQNMKGSTKQKLDVYKDADTTETRVSREAYKLLRRYGIVIIAGGELSGKTTIGHQILKTIRTKERRNTPIILDRPEEFVHIPPDANVVVLLDDIYGQTGVTADSVYKWEKVLKDMLQLPRKDNMMLVVTSRSGVLHEARKHCATDVLHRQETTINMYDEQYRIRDHEKYSIVSNLVQKQRLKIADSDISMISKSIGHPYIFGCCEYLKSKRLDLDEFKDFLKCPFQFHMNRLQRIAEKDPNILALLVLMMKNGFLPVTSVEAEIGPDLNSSFQIIQNSLNIQTPVNVAQVLSVLQTMHELVITNTRSYIFRHNSVEDAVCFIFGKQNLELLLLWCPDRFLLNYTTLSACPGDGHFVLDEQHYPQMKRRLQERRSLDLFALPLFSVELFVNDIFESVVRGMPEDDIVALIGVSVEQKHGVFVKKLASLLSCAYKAELHQLLELACERGDVVSFHVLRKAFSKPCGVCLQKACKGKKNRIIVGCILLELSDDFQALPARYISQSIASLVESGDQNNLDMILELVKERTDYKSIMQKALIDTCRLGKEDEYLKMQEMADHIESCTLLDLAIEGGNLKIVENLMKTRLQEQDVISNLERYFHKSCLLGKTDIANALLSINPNVLHSKSESMETTVHMAASVQPDKGFNVLSWLLGKGVDFQSVDATGRTPLHVACSVGNPGTIRILLDQGAGATVKDTAGNTPIHANLMGPRPSLTIIKMLVSHGGDLSVGNNVHVTPLHLVCAKNDSVSESIVAWILATDLNAFDAKDSDGNTPVHRLLNAGGSTELLEILADCKADLNVQNNLKQTPLHIAASRDDAVAAEILLNNGCDPVIQDVNGQTPLHISLRGSTRGCSCTLVDYSLKRKLNLDKRNMEGQTVLHIAADAPKNVDIFLRLLECSTQVSVTDKLGRTPLHMACLHCREEEVAKIQRLLARGALVEAEDATGTTPLQNACLSLGAHRVDVVNTLLYSGADGSHGDFSNQTILHRLCSRSLDSDSSVLEILLTDTGVDVKDGDGNTPLHKTCASSGEDVSQVIQLLTSRSASVETTNNAGDDAIAVALRYSRVRYQELLESVARGACQPSSKYTSNDIRRMMVKGGLTFVSDETQGTIVHKLCEINAQRTPAILEYFLIHGSDVQSRRFDGMTALHVACSTPGEHTLAIIDVLISRGANCNAKDMHYETSLHKIAKVCNRYSQLIVAKLSKMGVDINVMNTHGNTALHLALCSDGLHVEDTVRELLVCGSDLKAINHFGETPLDLKGRLQPTDLLHMYCEIKECLDVSTLGYLVSRGVNINSQDLSGDTVLHKVCTSKNTHAHENISVLLQVGSDLNVPNSKAQTPYDVACFNGVGEETARMMLNWRGAAAHPSPTEQDVGDQAIIKWRKKEETCDFDEKVETQGAIALARSSISVHPLQDMHDKMDDKKERAKDDITTNLIRGNNEQLADNVVALVTAELFRGGIKSLIKRDKRN